VTCAPSTALPGDPLEGAFASRSEARGLALGGNKLIGPPTNRVVISGKQTVGKPNKAKQTNVQTANETFGSNPKPQARTITISLFPQTLLLSRGDLQPIW